MDSIKWYGAIKRNLKNNKVVEVMASHGCGALKMKAMDRTEYGTEIVIFEIETGLIDTIAHGMPNGELPRYEGVLAAGRKIEQRYQFAAYDLMKERKAEIKRRRSYRDVIVKEVKEDLARAAIMFPVSVIFVETLLSMPVQ